MHLEAIVTCDISGTTLTVTAITPGGGASDLLAVGNTLTDPGGLIVAGTFITGIIAAGGAGVYHLSITQIARTK